MIDLHAHILPDLDDGARDWDETLAMCTLARDDGIHTIVATPHIKPGVYSPSRALIFKKVAELNARLTAHRSSLPSSGVKSETLEVTPHDSRFTVHALTVLPGADNSFEPDILRQIENGVALTIGADFLSPNSLPSTDIFRYVLLELSDYFLFPQVKDCIRKLREKNIVPILSHPERNAMIQKNYKLLGELIQAGALSQVTAMSVTGEFGKEIKKLTRTLIKKNLVHIIATDAHSKDQRPPILSRAVSEAADLIGSEKAASMVQGIPQAIIKGKEIDIT